MASLLLPQVRRVFSVLAPRHPGAALRNSHYHSRGQTTRSMLRVALTGGIATGKSYCLARFASFGVPVIDADQLARDAVAPGSRALEEVAARFGPSILLADGSLDRPSLGRIVFTDRAARADLEAIVHPDVYRRIGEWLASLPPGTRVAIADIPLLFETGHTHDFDRVVV